jgi:chemotaxis protein MotB
MANQETGNIIIKKIKKGGHGHHGGAWKVAYADFVTAMMAFFLLLWLLSSTSEEQKEGIAEYFTPTIGVKDSMGIGFEGGQSPKEEGTRKSDKVPPGLVVGAVQQGPIPKDPDKESMIEADSESKLFEKAEQELKQAFESDPNLREFRDSIIVEQTPEGLKISVIDQDKKPMFQPGNATISDDGKKVLTKLGQIVQKLPNHISITGHTDASKFKDGAVYTNWELSADRANSTRRFFLQNKMEKERVKKVVGMADQELLVPEEPESSRNRRITIILLRNSHLNLPASQKVAPRSLLTVPRIGEDVFKGGPQPRNVPQGNTPAKPGIITPITQE